MAPSSKQRKKRPREYLREASTFVRDYTSGLNVRDVRRLFDQEAPRAYKVLARGREEELESKDDMERFFSAVRVVFLGISARLSPTRRLLFAFSIVSLLWALIVRMGLQVPLFPPVSTLLNASTLWFVASAASLLFLLTMEMVDRVRVRDELEVARQLQTDLLPRRAPKVPGYEFAHFYRTANEVGGDYYDFQPLPDGRLALMVGDASGHGIAAGLLMAIANATLKTAIEIDPSPIQVATLLNKTLFRTGDRRAFMTLFYAVLQPETGEFDYVCAGHPFPVLRRVDGNHVELIELGSGSLPLGMKAEPVLPRGAATLKPGESLVLFTDGLPEAAASEPQGAFGFDRLCDLVRPGGSPAEIHKRILGAFDRHLGEEPLADDFTLVIVGHRTEAAKTPPPPPPPPEPA